MSQPPRLVLTEAHRINGSSAVEVDDTPTAPAAPVETELATDAPAETDAPETPNELTAKVAALEALVAQRNSQFEAEEPSVKAPVADVDVPADPAPETASDVTPTTKIFGPGDDLIDEDLLRELVSEIVREELQGRLGERITRNVRKLVRREIHRAIAAQELD